MAMKNRDTVRLKISAAKVTPQAVIRGKASLESVIHSDGWPSYDGLADVGYAKHRRVDHGSVELVGGATYMNGIEGFRGHACVNLPCASQGRRVQIQLSRIKSPCFDR